MNSTNNTNGSKATNTTRANDAGLQFAEAMTSVLQSAQVIKRKNE